MLLTLFYIVDGFLRFLPFFTLLTFFHTFNTVLEHHHRQHTINCTFELEIPGAGQNEKRTRKTRHWPRETHMSLHGKRQTGWPKGFRLGRNARVGKI